ncbi:hypothetical protein AGLY_004521 [Aphis glycines]|uniref:Uncharacterized protein n=1 Tax=Aphis glycines TaxID=307491 RepID=A0A6G0TYD2_APHGL|nr:hypothetical protein AGLY_004521 [Aphis glycines]
MALGKWFEVNVIVCMISFLNSELNVRNICTNSQQNLIKSNEPKLVYTITRNRFHTGNYWFLEQNFCTKYFLSLFVLHDFKNVLRTSVIFTVGTGIVPKWIIGFGLKPFENLTTETKPKPFSIPNNFEQFEILSFKNIFYKNLQKTVTLEMIFQCNIMCMYSFYLKFYSFSLNKIAIFVDIFYQIVSVLKDHFRSESFFMSIIKMAYFDLIKNQ